MIFMERLVWPLTHSRQSTQWELWSPFHPEATGRGPSLLSTFLPRYAVTLVGQLPTAMLFPSHTGHRSQRVRPKGRAC